MCDNVASNAALHSNKKKKKNIFGNQWKLVGDSACVWEFLFVRTLQDNTRPCRSRIIIEDAFGWLNSRFRSTGDPQNVNLEIMVQLVLLFANYITC